MVIWFLFKRRYRKWKQAISGFNEYFAMVIFWTVHYHTTKWKVASLPNPISLKTEIYDLIATEIGLKEVKQGREPCQNPY